VNKLLDMLLQGFIPKSVPYDQVISLFNDACTLNGMKLNVADTIMEVMIAELSRDANDIKKPFRYTLRDKPGVSMYASKRIKMLSLARLTNNFAAISSADPKQGITVSIGRERTGEPQAESAVEKAITDV
jgi:hypothetical protein